MPQTFVNRMTGPWPTGQDSEVVHRFWSDCEPVAAVQLKKHADFLEPVVSGSPYLRSLVLHDPHDAIQCLAGVPEVILDEICKSCGVASDLGNPDMVGTALRKAKSRLALLTALADLANVWPVEDVTQALTRFADAALCAAVNALLLEAFAAGKLKLKSSTDPSLGSGYVILAMGKHGACELNYSSDIDLIALYDPEAAHLADGVEASTFFVRITRRLVSLLQDVTTDGYVFRTDLRLRPDPRATQVAIAIEAAATYYENQGQNWERAAMIKARAAAGDITLGEGFLQRLRPYIWRKYLDFAAIADVQSLIRQIHAVKGHGEIAVAGHNLKLGRGGIREIEFFVQTQQLIAGGRNPNLRGRKTVETLAALADAGWISAATAADLADCYRFLRRLEHRAQMIDDQQTHVVPAQPAAYERFARFCGFATGDALAVALRGTLETVQRHSARLFEDAGALAGATGSLVFTGGEDDPDTIETLAKFGYRQPSEISATIRGWHFGRYSATRAARSRELLTELMPVLLSALARTGDADRTFIDFDRFLQRLPAGVQLFSMLKANPDLLDLIAKILGTAPRLAHAMSRQPRMLEAVLEPGFFGPLPEIGRLRALVDTVIPPGLALDEAMDRARVLGREQNFRVGVRVLSDTVSAEDAGHSFANVADVLIERMLSACIHDMREHYGPVATARVAVIAMGKLGGREMTAGSDLDLILIYDHDPAAALSNGPKQLSPNQYYSRLTQRFISALTIPTSEGQLYEVDLRLRPSGSKGPVAASLESFKSYHAGSAWTWEKLALTRARVVAGDAALASELDAVIRGSLTAQRDTEAIRADVVAMRALMLKEHKPASVWDIKQVRGGLVDMEFIAQYLQLVHARAHPDILDTNTAAAVAALARTGLLSNDDGRILGAAGQLYHRLTQVLRLCLDGPYDPAQALPGLNQAIAVAAGVPDALVAEALLEEQEMQVRTLFDRLVGRPDAHA